jgi:hypothetical protein
LLVQLTRFADISDWWSVQLLKTKLCVRIPEIQSLAVQARTAALLFKVSASSRTTTVLTFTFTGSHPHQADTKTSSIPAAGTQKFRTFHPTKKTWTKMTKTPSPPGLTARLLIAVGGRT